MDAIAYLTTLARYNVWQPLLASWNEQRFDTALQCTATHGVPQLLPIAPTLGHVLNHGTHHRGQISAAITAMGHACPALDLVWMPQDEGASRQAGANTAESNR
jgi:uncharacterized damage-inducible protein DinB